MKLEWLVPVIVVIVYVIGWIIKAKEEIDAKAQKPVGKAPGQELDKFLQEIDRLRRQNEAAPTAVSRRNDDDDDDEPVIVRPVVRPAPPKPVVARSRPVPTTTPVFPAVMKSAPLPALRATEAKSPIFQTTAYRSQDRSAVAGVVALLQNPRTASTAIILNEILGPPKSKR